jgi:hypothetical protein
MVRIGWRWLIQIVAGSSEVTFGIQKMRELLQKLKKWEAVNIIHTTGSSCLPLVLALRD